jgi:hypothetical protein
MTKRSRRRSATAAIATVLGMIAAVAALASPAASASVNREHLQARGWTCVPHPFAAPAWTRCFGPGLGLPFPGNPDPRPSYNYLQFELNSGAFVGTGHIIRGDLYRGQPCGPSGDPYVFLPGIASYDCLHA